MRIALISAILVLFMALGVVGLALRQPSVRFDEAVLVRVSRIIMRLVENVSRGRWQINWTATPRRAVKCRY